MIWLLVNLHVRTGCFIRLAMSKDPLEIARGSAIIHLGVNSLQLEGQTEQQQVNV